MAPTRPVRDSALAAVFVCLLPQFWADSALADGLTWIAPRGCPQQSEVARALDAQLAQRALSRADVRVEGRVRANAGGFSLTLTVQVGGRSATRRLNTARCADLAGAAAFLVALAATPGSTPQGTESTTVTGNGARESGTARQTADGPKPDERRPEENAAPAPPIPPTATPAIVVEAKDDDAARPVRTRTDGADHRARTFAPWWLAVGLDSGVWGAGLPKAQGVFAAVLALGRGAPFAELSGLATAPRSSHRGPVGEVRTSSIGGGLALCYGVLRGGAEARLGAAPCVSLHALRTHAEAVELSAARAAHSRWFSAGPMLTGSARLFGPFRARLALGVEFPVSPRPQYTIDAYGSVERARFLSGYGRLGIEARF